MVRQVRKHAFLCNVHKGVVIWVHWKRDVTRSKIYMQNRNVERGGRVVRLAERAIAPTAPRSFTKNVPSVVEQVCAPPLTVSRDLPRTVATARCAFAKSRHVR